MKMEIDLGVVEKSRVTWGMMAEWCKSLGVSVFDGVQSVWVLKLDFFFPVLGGC
jgi:hypothetical protein